MTALDLDTVAGHYARAVIAGHDGLAEWWAMRLDAADAERRGRLEQPGLLAESAAYLASRGLHVFPLTPGASARYPATGPAAADPTSAAAPTRWIMWALPAPGGASTPRRTSAWPPATWWT